MNQEIEKPSYYVFSEMLGNLYHTEDVNDIDENNDITLVMVNYTDTKLLFESQALLGTSEDEEVMQGLKRTIEVLAKRIIVDEDCDGENTINQINDGIKRKLVKVMKIGRNDKCVCGSGKKFKTCCIQTYA